MVEGQEAGGGQAESSSDSGPGHGRRATRGPGERAPGWAGLRRAEGTGGRGEAGLGSGVGLRERRAG